VRRENSDDLLTLNKKTTLSRVEEGGLDKTLVSKSREFPTSVNKRKRGREEGVQPQTFCNRLRERNMKKTGTGSIIIHNAVGGD